MNIFQYAFFLLFIPVFCTAQITKIRGYIYDAGTGESLPFVNITFKNTNIGTITDFNGYYFIETRYASDTIIASSLGYESQHIPIRKGVFQEINIQLHPQSISLEEVVITPGENPAHTILRNISKNKHKNNPEKIPYYQCEIYTKLQIDLNNVDENFRNKKIFNQFQFVFDNIDTNTITGKAYLPLFISENLSDFYYSSKPQRKKEIIKASQVSGIKNASVSQFMGRVNFTFNIYDNFMTLYESGFISPIADVGLQYYKYYLVDSASIDGRQCYQISFKPIRKQERTFFGDFWVDANSFAIVKMQMRLADNVNLNFINELAATFEYKCHADTLWYLAMEEILVDINMLESKKIKGLFGRKTSFYRNHTFSPDSNSTMLQSGENYHIDDDALHFTKEFWDSIRPFKLTEKEQRVYTTVDSIKKTPLYQTAENIVYTLANYYFIIGKFEYGPYFTTYSFNEIEGQRLRIGGQTSNKFSTRTMFNAHMAYGFRDERFKYGIGYIHMFSKRPRRATGASFVNDMEQLGSSINAFRTDNIISSVLRRNPNYKLTMTETTYAYYEHEWYQGFSNKISVQHKRIYPTYYIPFVLSTEQAESLNNITTSEITLHTHFAYDEIFLLGEFERRSLGTRYPEIDLFLTVGLKNIWNSRYDYQKINLRYYHYFNTNPCGYMKYMIDAGYIAGKLPYPLLELHRGNETYAFDYYSFNMMNYYEFVSDRYVSLFAEQHMQGFLLNRIPLIRKLKWREVLSGRGVIGSLHNANRNYMLFPDGLGTLSKPYYEAGIGIENIVKIFRIDAMWRLSYLDHPNIEKFGIRIKMQVIF